MIEKSLQSLSWIVNEEEYRSSSYASYSILSQFSREGPRVLAHPIKGADTSATRFGSLVDYLLTSEENSEHKYIVFNKKLPPTKVIDIVEDIINSGLNLDCIEDEVLLLFINSGEYRNDLKLDKNRINKFREEATPYFNTIYEYYPNKKYKVVEKEELDRALNVAQTFKQCPYTAEYFTKEHDSMEILYQTKFKLEDSNVRCMFDMLKVDHNNKIIIPIDIKTTSSREEDFIGSVIKWRYDIQAELYTYILKKKCSEDKYFSQFRVLPFTFIVANRDYPSPLAWIYDKSIIGKYPFKKDWKVLLFEYNFHMSKQIFKYSYESVLNKGKRYIQFE